MATALEGKRAELEAKQKALAEVFAKARTDNGDLDLSKVDTLQGDSKARVEAISSMNTELNAVRDELKALEDLHGIEENVKAYERFLDSPQAKGIHPQGDASAHFGAGGGDGQGFKSLGEMFTESIAYKGWKRGENTGPLAEIDLAKQLGNGGVTAGQAIKTLMSTSAGWAPQAIRTGRLVEDEQRPVQLLDYIPSGPTDQNAVVYMEETTFTNNAAEASEGGTYGEAALALTERTSSVRKIAVFLPVTDEQMEDIAGIQAYVNNRLTFMVRQRLDSELAVGDGTPPNLTGLTVVSGTNTQAKSTDPIPDCIYKGMTKVKVTGRAFPDLIVMHSNDIQRVRLLRTTDGIYIWGNPSDDGPMRMWGLPVAANEALTEGTGLVGQFAVHCALAVKRNISLQVSNSHSTYFIEGKQAIRADMRAAFPVYRPSAFTKCTGLNT